LRETAQAGKQSPHPPFNYITPPTACPAPHIQPYPGPQPVPPHGDLASSPTKNSSQRTAGQNLHHAGL